MISNRLALFLVASRTNRNMECNTSMVAQLLSREYCEGMLLVDIMRHVCLAYTEVLAEPRFQPPPQRKSAVFPTLYYHQFTAFIQWK